MEDLLMLIPCLRLTLTSWLLLILLALMVECPLWSPTNWQLPEGWSSSETSSDSDIFNFEDLFDLEFDLFSVSGLSFVKLFARPLGMYSLLVKAGEAAAERSNWLVSILVDSLWFEFGGLMSGTCGDLPGKVKLNHENKTGNHCNLLGKFYLDWLDRNLSLFLAWPPSKEKLLLLVYCSLSFDQSLMYFNVMFSHDLKSNSS